MTDRFTYLSRVVAVGAALAVPVSTSSVAQAAPLAQTRTVYVANYDSHTLSYFPAYSTAPSVKTISLPSPNGPLYPAGVALSPDGKRLYIAAHITKNHIFYDSYLVVYDLSGETPVLLKTLALKDGSSYLQAALGVAVSLAGDRVYVSNYASDRVSVVSTSSLSVSSTIDVGEAPAGLSLTADGKRLYVANYDDDNVMDVDLASGSKKTVSVGAEPFGVATDMAQSGRYMLVTNLADGTVSQIDTTNNTVVATVEVGDEPGGVATQPFSYNAFVANTASGTASDVDYYYNPGAGLNPHVEATYTVQTEPASAAVTPNSGYTYVANKASGTVSMIDLLQNSVVATIKTQLGAGGVAVSPNQPPIPKFTSSQASAGQPVKFDASGTTDPEQKGIHAYTWSFGDGVGTSTSSSTISHTYKKAGTYTVKVTVMDKEYCSITRLFGGQTVSCNGSSAATYQRSVTVK